MKRLVAERVRRLDVNDVAVLARRHPLVVRKDECASSAASKSARRMPARVATMLAVLAGLAVLLRSAGSREKAEEENQQKQ